MQILTKKEWIFFFIALIVMIVGSYSFMESERAQRLASKQAKEISDAIRPDSKKEFLLSEDYDFDNPTTTVKLPKTLHEISGLTDIDQHTLAAVQDENGIVFIYDWQQKNIKRQLEFGKDGDYEGITRAGNSLYILRSDGKLFEIDDFRKKDFKVKEYDTDIPVKDSEGLGYDIANNRLLIASKSEPKGDEYEDKKAVFAFDLSTKKIVEKPVFVFALENILIYGQKVNPNIPKKDLDIHPSGIAVHPITGKLFVLSSRDGLIYIFNQNSEVASIHELNKKIYTQPEGITFLDNGDMFISNEGKKDEPTLLKIVYKK